MSGLVIASIMIAVFFAAGVVLGVTMIVSLSVTGRRRRDGSWLPPGAGPPEPAGEETGYDTDDYDDTRPQWPDNGYRT